MSQYYYILNSRPNKPNMRPVKNTKQSIPVQFVEKKITEVKVEETPEIDVEGAKKHLQPLQQDTVTETIVAEAAVAVCAATEEVVEETPKKKKRGRKKAEEETEA
jgi:hypothetical protein